MVVDIIFVLSIISKDEYKKIVKHISDIIYSLGLTCCPKALLGWWKCFDE